MEDQHTDCMRSCTISVSKKKKKKSESDLCSHHFIHVVSPLLLKKTILSYVSPGMSSEVAEWINQVYLTYGVPPPPIKFFLCELKSICEVVTTALVLCIQCQSYICIHQSGLDVCCGHYHIACLYFPGHLVAQNLTWFNLNEQINVIFF